jgi:hypothetical protein
VLTAFEDGAHRLPDPDLLDRATALGRLLVALAIGLRVEQLELPAGAGEPQEFVDSLVFLPFR